MTDIDKLVGKNIQKRRESLNIKRRKFADDIGITEDDLVDFEAGRARPHAQVLDRIAKELGCSIGDLMREDKR